MAAATTTPPLACVGELCDINSFDNSTVWILVVVSGFVLLGIVIAIIIICLCCCKKDKRLRQVEDGDYQCSCHDQGQCQCEGTCQCQPRQRQCQCQQKCQCQQQCQCQGKCQCKDQCQHQYSGGHQCQPKAQPPQSECRMGKCRCADSPQECRACHVEPETETSRCPCDDLPPLLLTQCEDNCGCQDEKPRYRNVDKPSRWNPGVFSTQKQRQRRSVTPVEVANSSSWAPFGGVEYYTPREPPKQQHRMLSSWMPHSKPWRENHNTSTK